VASGPPAERAAAWWDQLGRSPTVDLVFAKDLYGGEHWTAARKIPDAIDSCHGPRRLWVASAGYGLVSSEAPLKAYSATFASASPDAVARDLPDDMSRGQFWRTWWSRLGSFRGPEAQAPRTVEDLALDGRRGSLVVVASPDYVLAMEDDLLAARQALAAPERLVIFSNGRRLASSRITDNLVAIDDRSRALVGGTMQGLNARVALSVLGWANGQSLDVDRLRKRYTHMTSDVAKPERPKGEPMTDEQVLEFITESLAEEPSARQTRLLRKLRDTGRSCEQARFRGLFNRVKQSSRD
jgi:hypothetical protein